MLQKILLALLVLSVSGCDDGPRISYCTVDARAQPELHLGQCSDPEEKPFVQPFYNLNNWVFISPSGREGLLKTCKHNRQNPDDTTGVQLTICVADCEFPSKRCLAQCSDGDKSFSQTVEQVNNWVGTSPRDTERLLRFCKIIPEEATIESLDNYPLLHGR